MISWLKGIVIQEWHISSKQGVVLACSGVGYEIQLLPKDLNNIDKSKEQELWIHQIQREDSTYLYGFHKLLQRDLFRKLISVNGIGAQIGMALLDDFEVNEFAKAIEKNDLNLLTRSQGVGKRIAERLVIELKSKLNQFKNNEEAISKEMENINTININKYLEEIRSILNSLGYSDEEIKISFDCIKINEKENIDFLNQASSEERTSQMEKHLREILKVMSKKIT
tara:strand:- start:147 stop:821 length:675 start_codon:yes stop_codon:yes gene_type:complete